MNLPAVLLALSNGSYQAIRQIAGMDAWRREENVAVSHWWWYLDVLIELSSSVVKEPES